MGYTKNFGGAAVGYRLRGYVGAFRHKRFEADAPGWESLDFLNRFLWMPPFFDPQGFLLYDHKNVWFLRQKTASDRRLIDSEMKKCFLHDKATSLTFIDYHANMTSIICKINGIYK